MSDAIDRLRAHDPERHGSPEPPPVERVLALIAAEEARAAYEPAPDRRRVRGSTRPFAPARQLRGSAPSGAHLTLPARAVSTAFALGLAAAIVAATLLVALGGGPAGGPPSLAPGSPASLASIVHVRSRSFVERDGRRQTRIWRHNGREIGDVDGPVDRWSTASPMRWRQVRQLPPVPGSEMPGGTREETYADGLRQRRSSVGGSRIWRRAIQPELWKRDRTSALGDLLKGTADPRAAIQELMANGFLAADGEEVRDGRRLRRFAERLANDGAHPGSFFGRTIVLLDAESWMPVEISTERTTSDGRPSGPPVSAGEVFEVYEVLPPTEENLRLLELGGPEG